MLMATAQKNKPTQDVKLENHDPEKVKARLLAKYPPKVARKRAKQIVINKVEFRWRGPR
jgi:nitrogenase molybdenum-iron protein alpha chain